MTAGTLELSDNRWTGNNMIKKQQQQKRQQQRINSVPQRSRVNYLVPLKHKQHVAYIHATPELEKTNYYGVSRESSKMHEGKGRTREATQMQDTNFQEISLVTRESTRMKDPVDTTMLNYEPKFYSIATNNDVYKSQESWFNQENAALSPLRVPSNIRNSMILSEKKIHQMEEGSRNF